MEKEFKALLCNIYIIFLAVFIPLYTGQSYYGIGDVKYYLFRNASIFCLGLWVAVSVGFGVADICKHKGVKHVKEKWIRYFKSMTAVDYFMLAYAAINVLSALLSNYRDTAWLGYTDWHMGALTQIILVGIYFIVSREYDSSSYSVYAVEAALFIIVALGFCNRLGMDILGLYKGYSETDWEYSHMLSTAGNINWLCGYMAVALPFSLSGYMYSNMKHRGKYNFKAVALYILCALSLTMLIVNGSDIGIVLAAICIMFCMTVGMCTTYRHRFDEFYDRALMLAAGTILMTAIWGELVKVTEHIRTTPDDGFIQQMLGNNLWWVLFIFLTVIYVIYHRSSCRIKRAMRTAVTVVLIISVVMCSMLYLIYNGRASSVSQRLVLWKTAFGSFLQEPFAQKLIGAGPDCFAEVIYKAADIGTSVTGDGYWQGTVYANAHNEWINQLINIGIIGTAVYAGVFVSALRRYNGMLLGITAVLLYFVNSMVSFQQVLNAPIFFVILGLCENKQRGAVIKPTQHLTSENI
jgi:hypothetical protein